MRFDIHIHTYEDEHVLQAINELKEILLMTQEDFDAQIADVNAKLDALGADVAAEADEIAAFIAAQPPEVDTSALSGVVDRLTALDDAVKGIFTPPATEPAPEPAPAPEEVA